MTPLKDLTWKVRICYLREGIYFWIASVAPSSHIFPISGNKSFATRESALADWTTFAKLNGLEKWKHVNKTLNRKRVTWFTPPIIEETQ